jgi:hypothetical protein
LTSLNKEETKGVIRRYGERWDAHGREGRNERVGEKWWDAQSDGRRGRREGVSGREKEGQGQREMERKEVRGIEEVRAEEGGRGRG